MIRRFRRRSLDLLGSIYIDNEHRGYTALDRVARLRRRTDWAHEADPCPAHDRSEGL
jgi:hypothetical protein